MAPPHLVSSSKVKLREPISGFRASNVSQSTHSKNWAFLIRYGSMSPIQNHNQYPAHDNELSSRQSHVIAKSDHPHGHPKAKTKRPAAGSPSPLLQTSRCDVSNQKANQARGSGASTGRSGRDRPSQADAEQGRKLGQQANIG
jgi:hypothetical protein